MSDPRPGPKAVVLVFLAALALQLLMVLTVGHPGGFGKYPLAAVQLLNRDLAAERLMDFSPFYLHLFTVGFRLMDDPVPAIRGLQILLAAGAVALLFALLRERFGTGPALLGAAFLALDRHLLIYARILEPEALFLFLLLAFALALERQRYWLAGFAAALCLAIRPTFIPVFALAPLVLAFRGRRWLRPSLCFALPIAAILMLLGLRAHYATGDASTPVMNPGTVFFEGNNPLSRGTSAVYPPIVLAATRHSFDSPDSAHQLYRDTARAATGKALSIAEVNAYWSDRALAFMRAEPGRLLALWWEKLVRICHGYHWHDVPTARALEETMPPWTLPFAPLAALALLGFGVEARRWRRSLLYYLLCAAPIAVMVIFYVSSRQRLALIPGLAYFALSALVWLRSGGRRALMAAAAVVALAVLFSLPNDRTRDETYRREGQLAVERGLAGVRARTAREPLAAHAEATLQALAAAPWWRDWTRPAFFPQNATSFEEQLVEAVAARLDEGNPPAVFDLGALSVEIGQPAEAERLLAPLQGQGHSVYRGAYGPSWPAFWRARSAALEGRQEAALELLRDALERAPGDPFLLAELLALDGDPTYQRLLLAYWSPLDAQLLTGKALLVHGRPREATAAFTYVVRRLPAFREALLWQAAALGAAGELEAAAERYRAATRQTLEPLLPARLIVPWVRTWAENSIERPEVQLFAAQVLHQYGIFQEALERLEALEPPPQLRQAVDEEAGRLRKALAASGE